MTALSVQSTQFSSLSAQGHQALEPSVVLKKLESASDHFMLSDTASVEHPLAKTEQEALEKFAHCKTREGFIELAKSLDVVVHDAEHINGSSGKQTWVNQQLQNLNSTAFVYTPYSRRYGQHAETYNFQMPEASKNKTIGVPWNPEGTYQFNLDILGRQNKQGLFISSHAKRDTLMHELFHVLQEKNGLTFGVSPEVDMKVESFCDSLRKPSIKGVMTLAKLFVVSGLLKLTGSYQKPNDKTSFALSFYNHHQREIEANYFVIRHGEKLGLSDAEIKPHQQHLLQNKLMQFLTPALMIFKPQ